jgi:hypothetical protein
MLKQHQQDQYQLESSCDHSSGQHNTTQGLQKPMMAASMPVLGGMATHSMIMQVSQVKIAMSVSVPAGVGNAMTLSMIMQACMAAGTCEHHSAVRTANTPRHQASCSTAAELQQQQLQQGTSTHSTRPGTSHSSRSVGSSSGSVASCVPGPPLNHSLLEGALAPGDGEGAVHRLRTSAGAPAAPSTLQGPQRRTTGGSSAASCAGTVASGCPSAIVAARRHPSIGHRRPNSSSSLADSGSCVGSVPDAVYSNLSAVRRHPSNGRRRSTTSSSSLAESDAVAERLLAQARAAEARRQRSTQECVAAVSRALLQEAVELADLHYERPLLLRWGGGWRMRWADKLTAAAAGAGAAMAGQLTAVSSYQDS